MDNVVLEVNGLTKKFRGVVAADNVSFQVRRGEIMGLLGPNGAGKTTLIRMILGIFAPNSGKAVFYSDGVKGALDKGKMGYLPEERGLYDDTNVLNNLIHLAGLKGVALAEAKKEASIWLERMSLADYAKVRLDKLSKGMQQKVQFIASILHKPEFVVFDEPFSGLDPLNQDFIKNVILELAANGTTVLLSVHQMNLVEELCDRIFLIHKGRRILYGTLDEIKKSYRIKKVNLEVGENEDLSAFQAEEFHDLRVAGRKLSFVVDDNFSLNDLMSKYLSGLRLESFSVQSPSLHEIFIKSVGDSANE